jgi:hypothetical protein
VAGCIGTCDADGAAAAGVGELDAPLSQDGSLGGDGDLLPAAVPGPPPAPACWYVNGVGGVDENALDWVVWHGAGTESWLRNIKPAAKSAHLWLGVHWCMGMEADAKRILSSREGRGREKESCRSTDALTLGAKGLNPPVPLMLLCLLRAVVVVVAVVHVCLCGVGM